METTKPAPLPEDLMAEGVAPLREVEHLMGAKRTKLRQMMDKGELRFVRIGNRRCVPRVEIRRVLAERLQGGSKP